MLDLLIVGVNVAGSSSCRSTSAARARAQQQTRRLPLLLSIGGTDRPTDGLTDTRPFYDAYRLQCGPSNIITTHALYYSALKSREDRGAGGFRLRLSE